MSSNFFFEKKNIKFKKIFSKVNINRDFIIRDIKPLHSAKKK